MANASEWAKRVAAWRASGVSASAFCADKEYSQKSLWYWSSHLNRAQKATRAGDAAPVPLARVVTKPAAPPATIVIEMSDARVHVSGGVDAASLRQVLDAVRACGPRGAR